MHRGREGIVRPGETEIVEAVARADSVEAAVVLVRDVFHLDHVTCQLAVPRTGRTLGPYVRSTYPAQWISRYLLRGYQSLDPVVREGFSSTRPFSWDELVLDERERAFMAESRAYGLGERGYAVPVVDRHGRRSLFVVNADIAEEDWSRFLTTHAATLTTIARIMHRKALEELALDAEPVAILAPREAECLLWTARGKGAKAIAATLEISEYTVRSYLRTARQKLECRTLSQAVAKAIQQGIIDP